MGTWTLDTIDWDRFDASKVDPEILRNIKAAAMVERNGGDYGIYLGRVFADDPAFVEDVKRWVGEEIQHGMALGRWAQLADPSWDFDAAFERFRNGYQLPLDATAVGARQPGRRDDGPLHRRDRHQLLLQRAQGRDRRAGAEADLRQDRGRRVPPLQAVLRSHAALPGARSAQQAGARLWIGWGRLAESEDDELAYAYYAANEPQDAPTTATQGPAGLCPPRLSALPAVPRPARHGDGAEGRSASARQGWLNALLTRAGLWFLRSRAAKYAGQGA